MKMFQNWPEKVCVLKQLVKEFFDNIFWLYSRCNDFQMFSFRFRLKHKSWICVFETISLNQTGRKFLYELVTTIFWQLQSFKITRMWKRESREGGGEGRRRNNITFLFIFLFFSLTFLISFYCLKFLTLLIFMFFDFFLFCSLLLLCLNSFLRVFFLDNKSEKEKRVKERKKVERSLLCSE